MRQQRRRLRPCTQEPRGEREERGAKKGSRQAGWLRTQARHAGGARRVDGDNLGQSEKGENRSMMGKLINGRSCQCTCAPWYPDCQVGQGIPKGPTRRAQRESNGWRDRAVLKQPMRNRTANKCKQCVERWESRLPFRYGK